MNKGEMRMGHGRTLRKSAVIASATLVVLLGSALLYPNQLSAGDLPLLEGSPLLTRPEDEYVPDQIIVKFKESALGEAKASLNKNSGSEVVHVSPYAGFQVLQIPEGKTVPEMVEMYSKQPLVEYAEPKYIDHITWSPNDTYYSYQWHFDQSHGINLEAAWDLDTTAPLHGGDSSIVVAIIDTGVAYETYSVYQQAPDLASTTFTNGYDFVNGDAHPNDDNGHGTHVCGTIAQSTDNSLGVAGIAFNITIMPIKTLDASGSGSHAQMADGFHYAADNGADIINYSASGSPSETKENAIAYAYSKGVTIICAAGNDYETGNDPQYPAAYDDYCIAVGATRWDRTRSYYSNTGSYLDVVAPGGDTTVDQNGDGYDDGVLQQTFPSGDPTNFGYYFWQGTSMACPHVAGVAALILAKHPSFTQAQVRQALESTATDRGAAGRDDEYGWGLINAASAVSWTGAPTVTNSRGASDVTSSSARLNGEITDTGGENPTVHIYWGDEDGGTTPGSWANHEDIGTKGAETFYTDISSLSLGTYYYRCYATNSGGDDWADTTESFDTFFISNKTPGSNALDIAVDSNIEVQFSASVNSATVNENTFNVDGSLSGKIAGDYSTAGADVTFNPDSDFKVGETVTVSLTTTIQSTGGVALPAGPLTWQFVVATSQDSSGIFSDSGQSVGSNSCWDVALGDVDGDGDTDAFVGNGRANKVWLNDGSGTFSDSGQSLGSSNSFGVALGDVDGDGDLDAFVGNGYQANKVWLNNSSGTFSDSGQSLGSSSSEDVALGDVDGDGDLDAFVANHGQANKVWLNNGSGTFSDSGQSLGSSISFGVALGDVDGDGDLDAFVANSGGEANKVWLNDGSGTFSDSGQSLGSSSSFGVALGDVDGDGDLDAFVINSQGINKVCLNDGSGTFSVRWDGTGHSHAVAVGDVDGDGDLDAFVGNDYQANKVWLNNSSGTFSDSGQSLGSRRSFGVALGDVDGDGDLDAFVGNLSEADKVWFNGTFAPTVTNFNGATNITSTSARLNGEVTDTGGENPTVHIHWGDNDGETTPGSWDNDVNLGTKGAETSYTDISGLSPGTTYFYRCYATNAGGTDWADSTETFDTLPASAPTVTNSTGASGITSTSAKLNGEVTSTGGENPTVHIYWGDNDGETTPGSWDHGVNLGTTGAETFYEDMSSLTPATTYYYRCYASNSAGSDWADTTESFTTVAGTFTLNITKTWEDLNGGDPEPGDTIRYTVTYNNNSTDPATGVYITDDYDEINLSTPSNFQQTGGHFLSHTDNGNTITWPDSGTGTVTLPAGTSGSISYQANLPATFPPGATFIQNTVCIEPTDPDECDTVIICIGDCGLKINKTWEDITGDPNVLAPGDTIRYTITYNNFSTDPATGVYITDDYDEINLSSPFNFQQTGGHFGTSPDDNGSRLRWPDDINTVTLPAGASGSVSYEANLPNPFPAGATFIQNTVCIEPTDPDECDTVIICIGESGISLTVIDREGGPAASADVNVYADPAEGPVNDWLEYSTDESGHVFLDVPDGTYTLAMSSWNDHFYIVKPDVTAPSTLTVYAADETVMVNVVANKVGGPPLAGASIWPAIAGGWPGGVGSTDDLGEATTYLSPFTYRDIFLWDWGNLYYLYHSRPTIPDAQSALPFDAAAMRTGDCSINVVDFPLAEFTPWPGAPNDTGLAPVFFISDGDLVTFSENVYLVGQGLRKTDVDERIWHFGVAAEHINITTDSSVTMQLGGDFSATVAPDQPSYDLGDPVTLHCLLADSFDNHITYSSVWTPGAGLSEQQKDLVIDRGEAEDALSAIRDLAETQGWEENYPTLTVTEPDGSVFLEVESSQLFYGYGFELPPDAPLGTWTATLSFDTGPHMGVIEGSTPIYVGVESLVLLSPIDGANVPGNCVTFQWDAFAGATKYRLLVQTDAGATKFDSELGNVTTYTDTGYADDGSEYSWQVWAGNDAGWSDSSLIWSFGNGISSFVPAVYTNAQYGFSVKYPANWSERPEMVIGDTVAAFGVPAFIPGMSIKVSDADGHSWSESVVAELERAGCTDIEILYQRETTVADCTPATEGEVTYTIPDGYLMHSLALGVLKGSKWIKVEVWTIDMFSPYDEAYFSEIAHTLRFGDASGDKIGVWQPSTNTFWLDVNGNCRWDPGTDLRCRWGNSSCAPLVGDWNGDGKDEIGVWQPSTNTFWLDVNGNCRWDPGTDCRCRWGDSSCTPLVGDWNGDGKDEIGVWQPSTNTFWLDVNGNCRWDPGTDLRCRWGNSSCTPLVGDWNGDGKDEIGVWQPSTNTFWLDVNGNCRWDPGTDLRCRWGDSSCTPLVGNWD